MNVVSSWLKRLLHPPARPPADDRAKDDVARRQAEAWSRLRRLQLEVELQTRSHERPSDAD